MKVREHSFKNQPEAVIDGNWDCIWVWMKRRVNASPLSNSLLQWLDWRMTGQISRWILAEKAKGTSTTFIPTLNRVESKLIAVHPGSSQFEDSFVANCEGMKLNSVLWIVENPERLDDLQTVLKKLKTTDYPKEVFVAVNEPLLEQTP